MSPRLCIEKWNIKIISYNFSILCFPTLKAFNINYKSACVLKADKNRSETVTKRKSTCKKLLFPEQENNNKIKYNKSLERI